MYNNRSLKKHRLQAIKKDLGYSIPRSFYYESNIFGSSFAHKG